MSHTPKGARHMGQSKGADQRKRRELATTLPGRPCLARARTNTRKREVSQTAPCTEYGKQSCRASPRGRGRKQQAGAGAGTGHHKLNTWDRAEGLTASHGERQERKQQVRAGAGTGHVTLLLLGPAAGSGHASITVGSRRSRRLSLSRPGSPR